MTGAGILAVRWFQGNATESRDFPEGTFWLCTNANCKAEFIKQMSELAEFYRANPDAPLPCPKCGRTETVRAARCLNCKRFYVAAGAGRTMRACPHCKQPLPRLTGRG